MAIWPTNNALPSRIGSGAFNTSISSLDWTYALPDTPAVPPGTVVKTWKFDTTREGWSTGGGAVGFDGTDGSNFAGASDPGCLHFDETLNAGSQGGSVIDGTWETLVGVPAGATVTDAKLRCRLRYLSSSPAATSTTFRIYVTPQAAFDPFNETVISGIESGGTAWTTRGETVTSPVSGPHGASSLPIEVTLNIENDDAVMTNIICNFDTVELTAVHSGTAAVHEHFTSPAAVSAGGFVWACSRDTNNISYLNCLNSSGVLQSHTAITNLNASDPGAIQYLAADDNDQCYLVLTDGVKAYATSGSVVWSYNHSGAGFSQGFKVACPAADGLVYVGNFNYANVHIEALDAATGALDHSFDTGCQDANVFALSGTAIYLPVIASGNPGVSKFSTVGVLAWAKDFTTVGNGFGSIDVSPTIFGSHVYVLAANDTITGFNAVVSLADTTGAFEWQYQNADVADYDSVSVGQDGTIYALLGWNGPPEALAAVDNTGAELWQYTNAAAIVGFAPAVGTDGTLLLDLTTKTVRVNTADGSEDSNVALDNPNAAALSTPHTYITDSATAGTLYAYTSGVTPPGLVDIIGGTAPDVNLNVEVTLSGALTTLCQAMFEIFVFGEVDGQLYSSGNYGNPTAIVIANPTSGHVAIVDTLVIDLAGFGGGRTGGCKIRRKGDDNCYGGEILILAIELYGDASGGV